MRSRISSKIIVARCVGIIYSGVTFELVITFSDRVVQSTTGNVFTVHITIIIPHSFPRPDFKQFVPDVALAACTGSRLLYYVVTASITAAIITTVHQMCMYLACLGADVPTTV